MLDKQTLSPSQFLERARLKHSDRYSYDMSNYKNTRGKVHIICPTHGKFSQSATNHLRGYGCPLCRNAKYSKLYSSNTAKFIEAALKVHGEGKFDYSRVIYKSEKVCIICPKHGEFYQDPNKHLRGHGCRKCSVDKNTMSLEEFINKANKAHGVGKYDYSRIESLKNSKEKVCIICPKHGEFRQLAGDHAHGTGCRRCVSDKFSHDRAMPQGDFINRANKFHNGRFDYSKVKYINSITKVCIICPIHGEFHQKPAIHLKTRGCPQCSHSLGERAVIAWFNKHGIDFDHFYSFPDLVSPKGKPLKFDFCTRHIKYLIEFDGEQHFRPVRFNSISEERAVEKFESVQYYDSLKDQYCIENNIPLIRISYKEFNNIPEILSEKLLGMGTYFQGSKIFC
jgi:hypothetical protein